MASATALDTALELFSPNPTGISDLISILTALSKITVFGNVRLTSILSNFSPCFDCK